MSGSDLEERVGRIEEAVGNIAQMVQQNQGGSGGKSSSEEEEEVQPSDPLENMTESEIEGLSNRDLLKLMSKQVQNSVQGINKRLENELSETRDDFSKEQVTRDLKALMKEHPEIKHLKGEFKEVIQHSPTMPIEDMYALINGKYPDRVAAAQEKVKSEGGEKKSGKDDKESGETGSEGEQNADNEGSQNQKGDEGESGGDKSGQAAGKGSGGGMTPSGSGGSSGDSTGSSEGKSSTREAGEQAWSEVFGSQEIVSP